MARLTALEQKVLHEFIDYLEQNIPELVVSTSLFGSKARGDSRPDSDIDVLIILSQENRPIRREILREAARLSLKYDVILSPRVIGADRWAEMKGFSLYQNVNRDSIKMELARDGVLEFEFA